jgi:hypothetical protein
MRTLRLILFTVGVCAFGLVHCYPQELPKYLDPSAPIEQRIDDLLPRLTTEEKIGQIYDNWGSRGIPRLKVPSLSKTEGLHSQSYSTGATIPNPSSWSEECPNASSSPRNANSCSLRI